MIEPRDEAALREDIVAFCRLLHQKNYLAANDGNVSFRLDDERVLVTPTNVCKAFIQPADLVVVDRHGRKLEGRREPTGELPMHLTALRARPDVRAVVHAHPPTCIALSLHKHLKLNGILPEVVLSIGRFEIAPYARPQTEDMARALEPLIARSDAVILERHGTLTVGPDLLTAYAYTERLEHAAEVLWKAYALGHPSRIPESELRALEDIHARTRSKGR